MGQDRNVFPVEPWRSWWRKLEERIDPQNRRYFQETGTQEASSWMGRGLRGSAYAVQPIRKDLVVVSVGSAPLKLGESWGSSCKACCYGSLARQAGRSRRKVPLSYVDDFSVKCGLGNGASTAGAYGWHEHGKIGDFILHCLLKLACHTVWSVHRPLCPLGLNITEQNKMPWISLWYTGCLDFRGSPWTPDLMVWY
jgi:hypothetical protein